MEAPRRTARTLAAVQSRPSLAKKTPSTMIKTSRNGSTRRTLARPLLFVLRRLRQEALLLQVEPSALAAYLLLLVPQCLLQVADPSPLLVTCLLRLFHPVLHCQDWACRLAPLTCLVLCPPVKPFQHHRAVQLAHHRDLRLL